MPKSHGKPKQITFSSSPYTALDTDNVIEVDVSGGAVRVNLPTVVGRGGTGWHIAKLAGNPSAKVTIAAVPGETINGAAVLVLQAAYEAAEIAGRSDEIGWLKL